jgi:hypothetical protein
MGKPRGDVDDFIHDWDHLVAAKAEDADGLDGPTHDQDQIIKRAQEAWSRLVKGHAWADSLLIGDPLLLGRAEAMRDAHTNNPAGRRYDGLFGAWLQKHGFDKIDKGDRSRLFACLEHRVEIEAWRSFAIEAQGMRFTATISRSRFDTGELAEISLTDHKIGSDADAAACDSAVAARSPYSTASLSKQSGAP